MPPDTVKMVHEWLEEHPDLSPIGYLWYVLEKQVRSVGPVSYEVGPPWI